MKLSQSRMLGNKRSSSNLQGGGTHDLAVTGFLPLRDEDEPLNEQQFQKLPGNLKKSYLMMEIKDDKLQQRIMKLRKK